MLKAIKCYVKCLSNELKIAKIRCSFLTDLCYLENTKKKTNVCTVNVIVYNFKTM